MKVAIYLLVLLSFTTYALRHKKDKAVAKEDKKEAEQSFGKDNINGPYQEIPLDWHLVPNNIITFEVFNKQFQGHGLSEGEIQSLWEISDRNGDTVVQYEEWTNFYKLFVVPFQDCNKEKKEYVLSEKDLAEGLKSPHLSAFSSQYNDLNKVATLLLNILDRHNQKSINLLNYIFLRKVNLAWNQCSKNARFSTGEIGCGLGVISNIKNNFAIHPSQYQQLFDLAMQLNRGLNTKGRYMDLLTFANIGHLLTYYNEFAKLSKKEFLTKGDLERGIATQVIPGDFNKDTVSQIFGYSYYQHGPVSSITFLEFCSFLYAHRLFSRYATHQYDLVYLEEENFLKLLDDNGFDPIVLSILDSNPNPSLESLNKVSKTEITEKAINETSYLMKFSEVEKSKDDAKAQNRKIAFTSFEAKGANKMEYIDFLQFFKLSICYSNMNTGHDNKLFLYTVKEAYWCFPGFQLTYPEFLTTQSMISYMGDKPVTIKEYFSFFTVNKIFNPNEGSSSSPLLVSREKIERGVKCMGFEPLPSIIQDSRDGIIGSQTNKYNPEKAQRHAIEIELMALALEANGGEKAEGGEGEGEAKADDKKADAKDGKQKKKMIIKKK